MNKKQFMRLAGSIKHVLPNLRLHNELLFYTPVDRVLLGFLFDSSRWNKSDFYVYALSQPLFVPAETYNLGCATKLFPKAKGKNWNIDDDQCHVELIENICEWSEILLNERSSPSKLLSWQQIQPSAHASLEFIYSLMAVGEFDKAAIWLEKRISCLDKNIPWQAVELLDDQAIIQDCKNNQKNVRCRLAAIERSNRKLYENVA